MHRLSAYVIVHRTQSNQTPDAIQSDDGRKPIGWRTETDRTADAIRSDGGRNHQGVQLSQLHQQSLQSKNCTNKAYRTIHQGVQLSQLHQQSLQNHQSPKINKAYRTIISRTAA